MTYGRNIQALVYARLFCVRHKRRRAYWNTRAATVRSPSSLRQFCQGCNPCTV